MSKNIYTGPRTMGARRGVIKPNFSEADLARIAASDATDNLTGKAIHEIGTEISKTDFSKFKKKVKKDPLKPKKDTPEVPLDEDLFKQNGGGLDIEDVEYIDEEDDIYIPPYTPPPVSELKSEGLIKHVPNITATMGLPMLSPNSFAEPYPTVQTERVGVSTFAQDVSGLAGYSTGSLEEMAQEANPGSALSPTKRLNPEMEVLSEGDPIYGVGEGKSFAYGINIGKKQRNYERQVWENQRKNTEDKFGDLMMPAEGEDPNVTAQLKNYGIEILNDYKELRKNRMEMEDTEYVALEQELLSRSTNIKALRESLVTQANTWAANKDNASVSTPAESRDFFETISNNKGDLKIETVNGVLTLTGKTQAGKDVSIAANKIINGENIFRFNEKVDINSEVLEPLSKDLEKYKTDKQIQFGISKEMVPFEELEPRIDSFLKNYLKDRTAMQSVLGDGYGYTYEQQIAKEKEGVNLRKVAADALKEDLKRMLSPAFAQKDIQADPRDAAKTRSLKMSMLKEQNQGAGGSLSQAAADILKGAQQTELETIVQKDGESITSKKQLYNTYPNLSKLEGAKGIGAVEFNKGNLVVYGPQEVTETEQDGEKKSTRKTKVLASIDLTGSYDQALQKITNLLQQTGYKQATKTATALDQFNSFIESN